MAIESRDKNGRFLPGVSHNKGVIRTKENRERISDSLLGKYVGNKNPSWKGGQIDKECLECGEHFKVYFYRQDAQFCSIMCANKSPIRNAKLKGGNSSSFKRGQLVGKKHWNWKGGLGSLAKRERQILEIKVACADSKRRDLFTCQMPGCGIKGGKLHSHHIKTFSRFPELRAKVENLITLCENCHKRVTRHESEFEQMFIQIIKLK